jgi:tryptophan-rich sensory protein
MTFTSEYEPFFQPPGWIVGPIWVILYTCLAISFFIAWEKRSELSRPYVIFTFFFAQLALNLSWVGVFNSAKYFTSLLMLIFMILFSIFYALMTYNKARKASQLVWAYIAWISFAALINTAYYLEASA